MVNTHKSKFKWTANYEICKNTKNNRLLYSIKNFIIYKLRKKYQRYQGTISQGQKKTQLNKGGNT